MTSTSANDDRLIAAIRAGDGDAWQELIDRYEGRLLAFAESRLGDRGAAEDVVQETLTGFLTSLPNYDGQRSLESYLFAICAYKLTDVLRRDGRRPVFHFPTAGDLSGGWEPPGSARAASSMARSGERRAWEEQALVAALREQAARCRKRTEWYKLMCMELLIVSGWGNKEAGEKLGLTEQQVANFKFDFLQRLKASVRDQELPAELFPELHSS